MSDMNKSVCELLPNEACDLHGRRPRPADSRTRLKQYFLDPVLPMLTLLSMSVLTVVMLVVIVTTVADMDTQLPDSYVGVDPWSGWTNGSSGGLYQDRGTYAELTPSLDSPDDRDLGPGAAIGDRF